MPHPDASTIAAALRAILPAEQHAHAPALAQILADALAGRNPALADPMQIAVLRDLQQTSLPVPGGAITVGAIDGEGIAVGHQATAQHATGTTIAQASHGSIVLVINVAPQPPALPVPFLAPAPPEDFVPRPHEFDQVLRHLQNPDGAPVAMTAALAGAGGYGKTTLAKAVCHDPRVREAFPDGVLWVEVGQEPGNLIGKVEDLVLHLTGERQRAGFTDLPSATLRLAQALGERRLLLVIDDVWDRAHLQPFLEGGPRCTRLVTTRLPAVLPAGARAVPVDAMQQDEAVALLRFGLPAPDAHGAAFHSLAGRLGEWALLLKLANGVLRQRVEMAHAPLPDALAYLTTALDRRGLTAFDARNPHQREQAVARTIGVSLSLLSDEEQARFAELAVFPEDVDVPLATVARLWAATGQWDDFASEELCVRLASLSLLLRCDLAAGVIRLHDVFRAYLREQHADLPALHAAILDEHRPASGNWADLPGDELYLWRHLAMHLYEAGRDEELAALLLDFDWLRAKLTATDMVALLADYDVPTRLSEAHTLVRDALRLSSHVLVEDPVQLPEQLFGRLLSFDDPAVTGLLAQAAAWKTTPWLRPLYRCLSPPGGPLIRTLAGHTDEVYGCALSDDRRVAVSASADGTLKVWDVATGQELRTLVGHLERVTGCAVSADGQVALSASKDGTLKVWDVGTGQELRTLAGQTERLGCALSGDGQVALSASKDGTLKVWDVGTGQELRTLVGHLKRVTGCAVSADGQVALSASDDETLKVWDVKSGRQLWTLAGHRAPVVECALSGDGRIGLSASDDETLKVWDVKSGRELWTLAGHRSPVVGCALSRDGRIGLSASYDGTLKVWDVGSGRELQTLLVHANGCSPNSCALSADGQVALSASDDRTLKVWDVEGGETRTQVNLTDSVTSCALSADGQVGLSASDDRTLKVWDVGTGQELRTLAGHTNRVTSCGLSADGQIALSASLDTTLRAWDVKNGRELHTLYGHTTLITSCALSADGQVGLSACVDGTMKAWDVRNGRELRTQVSSIFWSSGNALRADGRVALSASDEGTLKVWDVEDGGELRALAGHTDSVTGCALSADGRVALSASKDRTLKVWDTQDGRDRHTLHGHASTIAGCALSADGRVALSASADQTLKVWIVETGSLIATFYGDAPFSCCAVSADGRMVIAGDTTGVVHFLRLEGLK